MVVDDLKAKTLLPILQTNIAREARILTDEAGQYKKVDQHFARAMLSPVTVKANMFPGLTRRFIPTPSEFDFRYNNRVVFGVSDA